MSDASFVVTYTFVNTDSEPWRFYGEDSAETEPPRVIVYRYDGFPIQLVAPPSPNYVQGPEHHGSTDIPEADMPPRKKDCLTTSAPRFEIEESSAAGATRQPGPTKSDLRRYRVEQAGYGITDMWDKIVDTLMVIAPNTLEGVNQRMTELDTTVRQRTDEFEIRFEEAQDDRALLRARVNTLFRDRLDHRHTAMLMDREAMYAHEAWAYSEDRSSAITAHVRTLEEQVAA
nr:hypothetical protein [Tanacetum cinerariifolium]